MWKRKCEELIEKNNNLEEQILKMKVLPNVRTLEMILTPGQIRLLLNPSKRKIHWNADDIASAISLRSVSLSLSQESQFSITWFIHIKRLGTMFQRRSRTSG
jgi:hypothetical protein